MMKNMKWNWLVVSKLTHGIWRILTHEEFGKIFTRALESLQIGTLIAYFCLNLKMYELKIYSKVVSWQWRIMQKLKRNWLVSSKLTWEIWRILTRALENLKNLHFNGLLLTKVYNVWAKKVQRSYVWWYWILMKNWSKTELCF